LTVPVLVFEYLRKDGPVLVLVLSNIDEKLDRTGLPSTSLTMGTHVQIWMPVFSDRSICSIMGTCVLSVITGEVLSVPH